MSLKAQDFGVTPPPTSSPTSTQTVVQQPQKSIRISSVGFGFAIETDKYPNMSYQQMLAFAENPAQLQRDLSGMTEKSSGETAGAAFYSQVGIQWLNHAKNEYRNQEIRLGFGLHSPREAMVTFKDEQRDTSVVFCNLQSAASIDASYLFKGMWGKRFHWYGGLGLGFATSFDNEMMVISGKYFPDGEHPSTQPAEEQNMETYKGKSTSYGRLFIPFGFHFGFTEHFSMGIDFRRGIGYQKVRGEKANFINDSGSLALGFRFYL